MIKKTCLLIAVLALALVSCRSLLLPDPEFTKSAPADQPVERLFELSKVPFVYNPIVDTTAIYVAQLDTSPDPIAYYLLRFSNNGVFYETANSGRTFNVFDYNSFTDGQFGRYIVEDGDVMKLEFYHLGYRAFIYWYGKIDHEKIHFVRERKRSNLAIKKQIGAEDYIYYKQKADITKRLVFPK